MFWRKPKASRTGPLLLAVVEVRPSVDVLTSMSPEDLVRHLRTFHDSVEYAARATDGNVVQFIGNVSLVAWRCDLGARGCNRDPVGTGRRVLDLIRSRVPSPPGSPICVGLALGECVYEEQRGRVLSAMGHVWLRITRDFKPTLGGDRDAIVVDRSLLDSLVADARTDVGGGWYREASPPVE